MTAPMTREQRVLVIGWMMREIHILQSQARDYAMRGEQDRVTACQSRIQAFEQAVKRIEEP